MAQSRIWFGSRVATSGSPYTLAADSAAFTITGTAASLEWGHKVTAASGSYVISGTAADLIYTPVAGAYTLEAESAAFTISGTAAALKRGLRLDAGSGTYTITGTAAGLETGYEVGAGSGTFLITGTDATLVYAPVVAQEGAGGGIYNGPYRKPTRDEISRLQRLMNFDSIRETKRFIKENPEPARMALAVFEITADPDALIDAVLGQTLAQRDALKLAADNTALARMRQRIQDDTLELLLILAALEW